MNQPSISNAEFSFIRIIISTSLHCSCLSLPPFLHLHTQLTLWTVKPGTFNDASSLCLPSEVYAMYSFWYDGVYVYVISTWLFAKSTPVCLCLGVPIAPWVIVCSMKDIGWAIYIRDYFQWWRVLGYTSLFGAYLTWDLNLFLVIYRLILNFDIGI